MYHFSRAILIVGIMGLIVSPLLAAPPTEIELQVINFTERHKVEFQMVPSQRVPGSLLTAKVEFEEGQHRIAPLGGAGAPARGPAQGLDPLQLPGEPPAVRRREGLDQDRQAAPQLGPPVARHDQGARQFALAALLGPQLVDHRGHGVLQPFAMGHHRPASGSSPGHSVFVSGPSSRREEQVTTNFQ